MQNIILWEMNIIRVTHTNFRSFKLYCERHHWYTCMNNSCRFFVHKWTNRNVKLSRTPPTVLRFCNDNRKILEWVIHDAPTILTTIYLSSIVHSPREGESARDTMHLKFPRAFSESMIRRHDWNTLAWSSIVRRCTPHPQVTHSVIRRSDPRLSHATLQIHGTACVPSRLLMRLMRRQTTNEDVILYLIVSAV